MHCPTCGHANPAEAGFCMRCGTALVAACPRCETPLPPGAAFCFRCGAPSSIAGEPARAPVQPERDVGGTDLRALIARAPEQRLPLDQSLRIAEHICLALAQLHQRGDIHGQLAPARIRMLSSGEVELETGGAGSRSPSETVQYLAPEQALGRAPDQRSDLYSFGALLYELVTGRPPFQGDDPVAVIGQHINAAPVAPSWHNPYVPKPLDTLILRLLAKDPTARPAGVDAVLHELAGINVLSGSPYRIEQRRERAAANPLDRLAGGIFVGREQELGRLRAAFDAALAGHAGVALLAGEPGIGKTTLAEETMTYARMHGAQVFWGRCYEWQGAPAYWPWVQIVRAYVEEHDPQRLRSELGPGASAIAQVVPEVREKLPDLPEPPHMEGEQARFRLFDSIARFLRAATTRQPLLLALDDLHWADTPTLLLVQFIARELAQARLLIIGTYRDIEVDRKHPLSATLADLARGQATQRLLLPGLTPSDIARFIVLSTGNAPDPALVDAVQRETEGNPFFVSEVVRLLVSEGRLGRLAGPGDWNVGIPESVRDVVGRRLDRLSETCNQVLMVASVVGREFALPILERVCELPAETVLDALEEAVRARLVQREATGRRYRFTHALVQDTLYGELSAGRRLRLHAAVGRALEHLYAADLAPHYGQLAYHYAQSTSAGNAEKAVEYAVRAGDQAMAQVAWETAIQQYERALHVLDLQAEPDAVQRCDVLLALGSAQYHTVLDTSESPEGRAAFLRAAEIAQSIGDFERLARAALGFVGLNAVRTAGGLQQVRLLEQALALAPPGDNPLTARVMGRLAVDLRLVPGSAERIADLSERSLAMARRIADPAVLAPVLIARFSAIWRPATVEERIRIAQEAWRAAQDAGDVFNALWGRQFQAYSLYEAGSDQFEAAINAARMAGRQSRIPYFYLIEQIASVGLATKEGRYAEAEAALAPIGGESQALITQYARAIGAFQYLRELGRLAELEPLLGSIMALARNSADPFDWGRATISECITILHLLDAGRRAESSTRFAAFVDDVVPQMPVDPYWLAVMALLSDACAGLDDRERAPMLYDLLAPYGHLNANPGSGAQYLGSVAYYLGLLATTQARWDAAADHFAQAMEMNERMHAPTSVAWTRFAWAEMLVKRNGVVTNEAVSLLAQTHETALALGMTRLERRSTELTTTLEALPRTPRPADAQPFGLTARERDVLRLIVTGNSDREIAEALFISPRTVTTHVTNIFNKLGLSTRAEAAAFAVRSGLA